MNYWVITDLHLGHEAIVTAGHRPRYFEEKILKGIYNTVKEDDILICLGDVAFGGDGSVSWVRTLRRHCKGKLWLTLGNHDRSAEYYLKRGFDFVGSSLSMVYMGKRLCFSHCPHHADGLHDLQIHGHLHKGMHHAHEALPEHNRQLNICMEGHYQPYSLKSLIKKFNF